MRNIMKYCVLFVITLTFSGYASYPQIMSNTERFSTANPSVIKTMTFNVRTKTFIDGFNGWNHRKDIVLKVFTTNSPDVIGLQETQYSQYMHIRQALPQYGSYVAGRKNGKESGESCPILYRKDRFRLTDAGTFWFSDTPSVPGSKDWGNMPPRICSWAHLVETRTGAGFYVYNVHLDNFSQKSRKKSVQLLTEKINTRKIKDPFILMGDFNMDLENPAMQYLDNVGQSDLHLFNVDAWQTIHPGRTIGTRHGFRGSLKGPQIDHIRISSSLQALDARIDARHSRSGRYPSDHFPVIAHISLGHAANRAFSAATPQEVDPKL